MNQPTQFAEMTFSNGASMFLNTDYIASYGYLKEQDKTVVAVLSEHEPVYFPGDQTEKIRNAFKEQETVMPKFLNYTWRCGSCNGYLTAMANHKIRFCPYCGKVMKWDD